VHDARIIRLNKSHLPFDHKTWLGDSVGYREGDALVYTQPFTEELTLSRKPPGELIYEYSCHEGN